MNPAAPAGVTAVQHSTFSSLVQDDDDLVGHVAYALYKREKLKFCEAESKRTGNPVTQEAIGVFILSCGLDSRIASYRSEAERLLEQMTEYVLADAVKEFRAEEQEHFVRKISEGKSWKRAIAENFIGSVVVALVWALIVIMVAANKVGPDKVIGDFLGKDISDRQVPPPPPSSSRPSGQ